MGGDFMNTKVSTFIYCLGTTNSGDKNSPLNAMGVVPVLTPEFIPSTFSFSIVIGIQGIDDACNHTMDIIFKDSQENSLVEARNLSLPLEQLKNGDVELPQEYKGIMLGMDLRNVIMRYEGVYHTEVNFDGQKLGDFDIYVKAKQHV